MKKLMLCCLLAAGFISLRAQTASTICMEELRTALQAVDQRAWLQSEKAFLAEYTFTYQMQASPDEAPATVEATTLISKGTLHQTDPDNEVYSNSTEAFVYRPGQLVIYQVNSQLNSLWLLDRVDPGILDYATVNECNFIPPTATDSTFKEYKLSINAEGQAKYKVTSLLVITNPVGHRILRIKITYAAGAKYTFTEYRFHHIHQDAFPGMAVPDVRSYIYAADGNLLPRFAGCKFFDRRR